jgi:broad-specificity NMP kinase
MKKGNKKVFLFIRGLPASGKISIAKKLEKKLGWKIIWLHSIKNAIFDIVKEHNLSELMRKVMEPITEYVLDSGNSIIFVRPATKTKTVLRMKKLVAKYPDYRFDLVTLVADQVELLKRARARKDPYRINNKTRLNEYMSRSGNIQPIKDELFIDTTNQSLKKTVDQICEHFGYK